MAPQGNSMFKLRTFCLVTGASQGLGRHIAIRLAAKFPKNSLFLLLSRNECGLRETATLIDQDRSGSIHVQCTAMDLGTQDATSLKTTIHNCLDYFKVTPSDFDQALIVHNAASIGDVSKTFVELSDATELSRYWNLTLTSTTVLNTVFLEIFAENLIKQRVTINISSICALQPFKSWSLYCAGKAARDMLFKTMALENPRIRVLNYAPGPIDTDMQVVARTKTADTELRTMFKEMKENEKLLTCDQSIDKLVHLLEDNKFDSGAHIDFYDL